MTTFLEQQNHFYEVVGDDNTSELYPLASVKASINAGESAFIAEKDNWSFLEGQLLRQTIADTTLDTDFEVADVTVDLEDSSTWPTASASIYGAYIEGDILETWTGNAANNLTGAAGLQVDHDASAAVKPMYYLPATIAKPDRILVNGTQYEYISYEQWRGVPDSYFTIYQGYLLIPQNSGGEILEIPYHKAAVTLTADANESLLPEAYRLAPVYYALGKMLLATDEIAKARQYCYFNPATGIYEGLFGELLYKAKQRYSTKTGHNKRRVKMHSNYKSK